MNTIIRGYEFKHELFSNQLFKVYEAEHSILKGQTLRVTLLNSEYMQYPELKSEFSSISFKLSFAEHPYIIRNTDMLEENGNFVILSENVPLMPLNSSIKSLSVADTIAFIEKIFDGLIYLNDKKIFHAALLPEFIYVDQQLNPRIAYYGIAEIFLKMNNPEIKNFILEQLQYCAPELTNNMIAISDKTEVYSCGKLLEYFSKQDCLQVYSHNITEIVNKATNSDIIHRYRNVKEMLNDIRNIESITNSNSFSVVSDIETNEGGDNSKEKEISERKAKVSEPVQTETQNMFEILDDLKHKKTTDNTPQQNVQSSQQINSAYSNVQKTKTASTQGGNTTANSTQNVYNSGQRSASSNVYTSRQRVSPSVSNQNKPVNAQAVLVLGIFAVIMSFIVSFFGIILSIIGFVKLSSNKKKIKDLKITLKQSDKQAQSIGAFLCIVAIIIAVVRFITYVIDIFSI